MLSKVSTDCWGMYRGGPTATVLPVDWGNRKPAASTISTFFREELDLY